MHEPRISRAWAMPNHDTFKIKPIADFLRRHLPPLAGHVIVDPFARNCTDWATHTNDINPATVAQDHMDAREYLAMLVDLRLSADAVIFDPPYSPRQISECYAGFGRKAATADTQNASLYSRCRNHIQHLLKPDGLVLSFGWNSAGMGISRDCQLEEILLVCHGAAHNDTICLAERYRPRA